MSKFSNIRIKLLRTICFFLLIVFIDQTAGIFFKYLYFNQKTGQGANLNYIFAESREEVLIFGNSRAQHHYDTKIIADSLNMSCYNAGIDGGHSILLPYALIKVILNRYNPKIIIIEFNPASEMEIRKTEYDRFSVLLPYYHLYPEIRPLILRRSPIEKYKLLSGIYPYNSGLINLIRLNTNIDAKRIWMINGYIPIRNKNMNTRMSNAPLVKQNILSNDPDKLKAIEEIIEMCYAKNIALFFINSPIFHPSQVKPKNPSFLEMQVQNLLKKRNTKYINLSNEPIFIGQNTFFADKVHLNEKGATRYSQLIGGLIKKEYDKYPFNKKE